MLPIAKGTYVNSTHWVSTFLCSGCIDGSGALSFTVADTEAGKETKLGWAWSSVNVANAGDPAASLGPHFGTNRYGMMEWKLAEAKNGKFAEWAALAKGA